MPLTNFSQTKIQVFLQQIILTGLDFDSFHIQYTFLAGDLGQQELYCLCMIADQRKHNVWLACMKLSNCTPADAVTFIKTAQDLLFQPITPTGQNILMVASSVGAYYVVRECILHGAEINKQDAAGRTSLHYAASIGNINIFEELVKEGGSPLQQTIGGETPLTKACIFCQGDIIEWYLNNALKAFQIADNYGKKPLDMLKLQGQELYSQVLQIYNDLTSTEMKD